MGQSTVGFINLLELTDMAELDGHCVYSWKGSELILSDGNNKTLSGLFELSSKVKGHHSFQKASRGD